MPTVQVTYNRRKLERVLSHAATQVPYYRDLLSELNLLEGRTPDYSKFRRIPFLTKELLRDCYSELIDRHVDTEKLVREYTSGTTGIPITCLRTKREQMIAEKMLWKVRMQTWGSDLLGASRCEIVGVFDKTSLLTMRRKRLELSVDMRSIDDFRRLSLLLSNHVPAFVRGYKSTLVRLAKLMVQGDVPRLKYRPKLVEAYSEYLPDSDKALIEEIFDCPVANLYACREVHAIGYTCKKNQMHVVSDNVVLEVNPIKTQGFNTNVLQGEAIVTSLSFMTMPIIRYQLGDLVQLYSSQCSCGSNMPRIFVTRARTSDTIAGYPHLSGSMLFPWIVDEVLLEGFSGIREFRVLQKTLCDFHFLIVPGSDFTTSTSSRLVERVRQTLSDANVEIMPVQEIPPHPSGKTKVFVNEI